MSSAPVVVAVKELGPPHSPWLWRQITSMASLDMEVLYWKPPGMQGLPEIGVPLHVLDADPHPYDGRGRWLGRVANLRGRNFYAALGDEVAEVRAVMQSLEPAVILCYYGEIALRTIDVADRLGIPVIAYFHGDFGFKHNRWYRWSLERRLGRFAEVVVVTEEERAWMLAAGAAPEHVHVIPCGGPTSQFLPRRHREPGGVRFVMASRLADEKGCRESIAAFEEVASAQGDATLDVYGDGPELADLRVLVDERGLADRVTFHGHVDSETLARELAHYDVFVQHSLYREGSPVSIVEAMACALPVVATTVGGNVDLVVDGSTGFLVPERDVSAMALAMLRLASSSALRDQMGRRARVRAVESFDSDDMTIRLERLVASIRR